MKKSLFFMVFVALSFLCNAQNINFPDANFKAALLNHNPVIDTNQNGEISYSEARSFTGAINVSSKQISDLTGIDAFLRITELDCSYNYIVNLDLYNNTVLERLECQFNRLNSLNLRFNTVLKYLDCSSNGSTLRNLNISNNLLLEHVICPFNSLTNLNISNNTALKFLNCGFNLLPSLNISNNTTLEILNCSLNRINQLNIDNNVALEELYCNANLLTNLDVSANVNLVNLNCQRNSLTALDVSNNSVLKSLDCYNNKLTSLNVANNRYLENLRCDKNLLTSLNVANNNNGILRNFKSENNSELKCIQIDANFTIPTSFWWTKDPNANYSDTCRTPISGGGHTTVSRLYPNPAMNSINIKANSKVDYIEIYSLEGEKLVVSKTIQNIDISKLRKGIYFVNVINDNGNSENIKFIKD